MDGPRPPRASEVDDLTTLVIEAFDFFRDLPGWERLRKDLGRRARMRRTLVIVEDGKPVSHIHTVYDRLSLLGCRLKVGSVSGVCTHSDYRGRGYAGTILGHTFSDMKTAGARIVIVSGDRGLYHRAHCVPVGDLLVGRLGRDSIPAPRAGLSVRRATPNDWPSLSALHSSEPLRFLRTADTFARLCARWDHSPATLWLVESRDRPLSYLWLGPLWSRSHSDSRDVYECAGSRSALVEAIPLILEAAELREIVMSILGSDRELAYLLSRRGVALEPTHIQGTHGILNLPGLMRDMRQYLAARLPRTDLRRLSFGQQGDTCTFGLGDERLDVDASQAARLVFGSAEAPSVGGELGRTLCAIFPLPLPMPGFNTV